MNGHSKLHPVGIDVRADMLESVAGMSDERVRRELAFAVHAMSENDPDSMRWLSALLARCIDNIEEARA